MSTIRQPATLSATALLMLLLAVPAGADDTGGASGSFLLGFRSVDVGGAENKFREDLDLEDGPRLFGFNLELSPGGFADHFEVSASNLGGDPFETLRLRMRKNGRYELTYDRRESRYFYEDTILPPDLADIRLSSGGDFHHFDFERVTDTAGLTWRLSPAAKLRFGFERTTKRGESTTTLDISRDEFELDKPIDESLDLYAASLEYSWEKVTLVLEERYRDYSNAVDIFLPGFSEGESPTGASLDFFFLDQPYDLRSNEHSARVVARPSSRLTVNGSVLLQESEIDAEASERSQGIAFNGAPFTTDLTGGGEVERDVELFDLDVSFRVTDRLALVASAWSRSLDQQGDFVFGGSLNQGEWDIETSGAEAGLQCRVSPTLVLAAGVREESRDVEHGAGEGTDGGALELDEESTDTTGFYANASWRPGKRLLWTGRYEDSSYDDPFTLSSPTDRQSLRSRLRWRWTDDVSLSGSYRLLRTENGNSGWTGDSDQLQLRLHVNRGPVQFSLGYGTLAIEREIDQLVVTLPGFGGGQELPFPIFYEVDTDFFDGSLRWDLTDRLDFGVDGRFYENSGSFGLERTDLRAYVEALCGDGYLVRVGYRTTDYDETAFDFDDYDADIFELGIGFRWGGSER